MINIFAVYEVSLHHFKNRTIRLYITVYFVAFTLGLLFILLGGISCRLIRLTRCSCKQQCFCGFSSGFAVVIKKEWMTISNHIDYCQLILPGRKPYWFYSSMCLKFRFCRKWWPVDLDCLFSHLIWSDVMI